MTLTSLPAGVFLCRASKGQARSQALGSLACFLSRHSRAAALYMDISQFDYLCPMFAHDTIVALATPPGQGALGIIRISGPRSQAVASLIFRPKGKRTVAEMKSHTVALGNIHDGDTILDEALLTWFRGPHSFTGEDSVELSCHGSSFILQQVIQLCLRHGCRSADPGEFTMRAFLNGKIDLAQAEAVADLIASDNKAAHQVAMQQMRGGFSNELALLREQLLNFASLIELELDFSEEDVEFADRTAFNGLLERIEAVLQRLIESFATGNVIKNGIPVAIAGEPNVGKSTLLNALLNEERAIVSEIAGTTRDTIEDEITIGGMGFRFIDTAGIRETADVVESIGIRKTFEKMQQARVILYLVDGLQLTAEAGLQNTAHELKALQKDYPGKSIIMVVNKLDRLSQQQAASITEFLTSTAQNLILISAKFGTGMDLLRQSLLALVNTGALQSGETVVTNARHYHALIHALEEIRKVRSGMHEGLSSDLLAIDIRQALYHFGEITGQVTNDELLGNIFGKFCIGK